ncbi:MAG: T9SS type A sorting domain-containing protein, partial [Bacteroidota bacterium]
LDALEWDVRLYFALGGAVHDAAVTAWGLKGWYDYVRPISAIRAMAALGQSTEPDAPDYHAQGLPLAPGRTERIGPDDPLAGAAGEHVGAYKIWGWLGPEVIEDPETDVAGVGWIRAAEWFPYQRPTFVTPPFAGYVSGHSTFSRAAAEVLTTATGDPFFPGGVGEFDAPQNDFLVFERGPSVDVTLQWATYRDAADQCSLSRIWGGIHPPADDLPGRRLGEVIGLNATAYAEQFFSGSAPVATEPGPLAPEALRVFPSPVRAGGTVTVASGAADGTLRVVDLQGRVVRTATLSPRQRLSTAGLAPGLYLVRTSGARGDRSAALVILR